MNKRVDDNNASAPEIDIRQLRFRYDGAADDVLQIDALQIGRGEFVSLLGASGSGKSTMLRLIAGLLSPSAGAIQRAAASSEMGMVFQSPTLVPWRSAEANIRLPAELGRTANVPPLEVDGLVQLVGLAAADMSKRPAELSGGMQMRVAIARALVLQPKLLLMDEPFAALDDVLRMQLETDVRRIHNERALTSILVTHNIAEAVFMSDRILVLGKGGIAHDVRVTLQASRSAEVRTSAEFHACVNAVTELLHASVD